MADEEEGAKFLVGDRYVDAWGNGDFVTEKEIAKIHKASAAKLAASRAADEDDEEDEDEDGDDDSADGYDVWNLRQLRAELTNRKLEVEGKKSELVARLEADDVANPA